jgi:hypothetical protein
MDELKSISGVFNFFTYVGVIVGGVCLFCSLLSFLGDNSSDYGITLLSTGVGGFVTAGISWFSKALITALNHIVKAARKYTNE